MDEERDGTVRYETTRRRGGRRYPCPTCGQPNRLTRWERDQGYQCAACADAAEGLGPGPRA